MSAKDKGSLKTRQRMTRPIMKEKWKLTFPPKSYQKRLRIPLNSRELLQCRVFASKTAFPKPSVIGVGGVGWEWGFHYSLQDRSGSGDPCHYQARLYQPDNTRFKQVTSCAKCYWSHSGSSEHCWEGPSFSP